MAFQALCGHLTAAMNGQRKLNALSPHNKKKLSKKNEKKTKTATKTKTI